MQRILLLVSQRSAHSFPSSWAEPSLAALRDPRLFLFFLRPSEQRPPWHFSAAQRTDFSPLSRWQGRLCRSRYGFSLFAPIGHVSTGCTILVLPLPSTTPSPELLYAGIDLGSSRTSLPCLILPASFSFSRRWRPWRPRVLKYVFPLCRWRRQVTFPPSW